MNITSVHIIVKNSIGQILLTQRCDLPIWVIPGGHVESREKPEIAAIREFLEETGHQIKITQLIARYKSRKANSFKLLFEGKILKTITRPNRVEVKDMKWFRIENLPQSITLYEKAKLNDYLHFSGKTIEKDDDVNKVKEFINQIKNPINFIKFIVYYIYNSRSTKSFKLNV